MFDRINEALVSMRDFLKKQTNKKTTDPNFFNGSVYLRKIWDRKKQNKESYLKQRSIKKNEDHPDMYLQI